jgi:hypothetical protein
MFGVPLVRCVKWLECNPEFSDQGIEPKSRELPALNPNAESLDRNRT